MNADWLQLQPVVLSLPQLKKMKKASKYHIKPSKTVKQKLELTASLFYQGFSKNLSAAADSSSDCRPAVA